MRRNPLLIEVLVGITRQGKAQLDYLVLLAVQAVVLLMWWPKGAVVQLLESQESPDTLIAVVMAVGAATAYHALRVGAEELLLPGQHRLRDWALATPLPLGRIVHGCVLGHLVHILHLLALSSPLVLMAFTVSGGEWHALASCVAAALVQGLFYALSGALVQLAIGEHPAERHFFVRAVLVVVYLIVGWLAPFTSHVAFTSRALGEGSQTQVAFPGVPEFWAFVAFYMGLSMVLALAVYLLLMRARAQRAGTREGPVETVLP